MDNDLFDMAFLQVKIKKHIYSYSSDRVLNFALFSAQTKDLKNVWTSRYKLKKKILLTLILVK